MKKKTIIIVSLAVVLALLAISVIATFPTYLFEDNGKNTDNAIKNESVTQTPGEDVGQVGGGDQNGVEAVLPDVEPESDRPTVSSKDLETVKKNDGATIKAEKNAMKGFKVEIDKLGTFDKTYYRARHYVRDFSKNWEVYEITSEKNGKSANPNGIAKLIINIPKKYDTNKVAVYYMSKSGSIQELPATIDKTARTATIDFSQGGVYILVEKKKAETSSSSTVTSSSQPTTSDSSSEPTISSEPTTDSSDSNTSSDTDSDTSSDASSDSSSTDANQDTMDGWSPWY